MNPRPYIVFLVLGSIFGLSFLIITPPFQIPDEPNHFLKAYQVSTGQFKGLKVNDRVGGYIPHAVDSFSHYFKHIQAAMYVSTKKETILKFEELQIEEDRQVFVDFPSTGKYSFVNYLPQSFSIFVLRHITSSVLWIYYGSKLFTLLFWLACTAFSIYIIPFHKWLFTSLALLPMSLYINSSVSGDVMTNATSFVLIAYLLRMAYESTQIRNKDLIIVGLLGVVLASTKLVYTPILLLFLLIPVSKFVSQSKRILTFGALMIITFGVALYWYQVMDTIYTSYSDYNPAFRENLNIQKTVNAGEQLKFLQANPTHIFKVLSNAMGATFDMVYEGFIGTLGWLETRIPLWIINLSYLVLFALALNESRKVEIKLNVRDRGIILAAFVAIVLLIVVTLFITWTIVGADYVHIQGRYLIPAAPLFFMLFYKNKLRYQKVLPRTVIAMAILSLAISFSVLAERFYVEPIFVQTDISCGAEEVEDESFLSTKDNKHLGKDTIRLGNGITRSNEMARRGSYSAKVNREQQYGFTYRTKGLTYGDKIEAQVWRFGEGAGLVISSPDASRLYKTSFEPDSISPSGWQRLKIAHVLTERLKGEEISIYVFNPDSNTVYFDDFRISILYSNR